MPQISIGVAVGFPHHVTQRENYQQRGFEDKDNFRQYSDWLKDHARRYFLKIWIYRRE